MTDLGTTPEERRRYHEEAVRLECVRLATETLKFSIIAEIRRKEKVEELTDDALVELIFGEIVKGAKILEDHILYSHIRG